jgi:hypothetical protein
MCPDIFLLACLLMMCTGYIPLICCIDAGRFQVSKVIWKRLLKKNREQLKQSKVYIYERPSFGKSSGKYMPYSKVDSFLKVGFRDHCMFILLLFRCITIFLNESCLRFKLELH